MLESYNTSANKIRVRNQNTGQLHLTQNLTWLDLINLHMIITFHWRLKPRNESALLQPLIYLRLIKFGCVKVTQPIGTSGYLRLIRNCRAWPYWKTFWALFPKKSYYLMFSSWETQKRDLPLINATSFNFTWKKARLFMK